MEKGHTQYPPPVRPRRGIPLPAWLDRLSARVARWPWWAIIIGIGLVAAFYSMATSDLYRRVLVSVTKNPQLITDQFVNVVYEVKDSEGATKRVSGVLTSQTADSVTVITQAEERVTIPREDLVKQTCESPAADGDCPINQPVSVSRRSIDGTLIFEDLGKYQIKTALGETVDVRKYTVARDQDNKLQEVRTPPGCSADPEGGCSIKLALNPDIPENEIKGILLESTPAHLLVQTVPPISVTIPKASIVNVVDFTPAQCALNNVAACNQGIFLTISVTLTAYILAMCLGLIFGLMRVSTNRVLFNLSTIYVEVVRGVPLLVILLFTNYVFAPWFRDNFPVYAPAMRIVLAAGGLAILAYYVLTRWSRRFTDPLDLIQPIGVTAVFAIGLILIVSFFGDRSHSDFDPVQRAVLGLAFGYGAFSAELFRAGIQSIGHGQMEAARSLGMSYLQAMRFVILPQAFRVILPPLGNDFIAMLKDTSLIAFLALPELTQMARLFAANTYRPFESYLTIGVLYLCMTLFLSFVVRVIERRTALSR
jgi:polar amino acid transport system permease protein